MTTVKQNLPKKSGVIKASEIGQYQYCSISWHLQRCGYEPKSPLLKLGEKKHVELGEIIDKIQINTKKSKSLGLLGYILITLSILILIFMFGVI